MFNRGIATENYSADLDQRERCSGAWRISGSSITAANVARLSPNAVGVLHATNLPLDVAQYNGKLGDKPITLVRRGADVLAFEIPADEPTGNQELVVDVDSKEFAFSVDVLTAPTVSDDRAMVQSALSNAHDALSAYLAGAKETMSATDKSTLSQYLSQLAAASAAVGGVTKDRLHVMALQLAANLGSDNQSALAIRPAAYDEQTCEAAKDSVVALDRQIAGQLAAGIGNDALVDPDVGVALVADGLVRLAGIDYSKLLDKCLKFKQLELEPEREDATTKAATRGLAFAAAATSSEEYTFESGKAKSFSMKREMEVDEAVAKDLEEDTKLLDSLADIVGHRPKNFSDFESILTNGEKLPVSVVNLSNVDPSVVRGTVELNQTSFGLTFSAPGSTDNEIEFSFVLDDGIADDIPLRVPATLETGIPKINDAAVDVVQDEPTMSQLAINGSDSLDVVSGPQHGSVILESDGSFTYSPATHYFGSDSFNYEGVNDHGHSKPATVLITVKRVFEGTWDIASKSVTTSATDPNLCPDESGGLFLTLAKSSDTLYVATYDGFGMNLSMASADDPAGLSGKAEVSYPDGTGVTSESIAASVPDSWHLQGQTQWTWTAGSAHCEGMTTLTGTRRR